MKKATIISRDENDDFSQNFWDILDNHDILRRFNRLKFKNEFEVSLLKRHVLKLVSILHKILKPQSYKEKFQGWLNPT